MARQAGNIVVTGTIDHLCFYQMDGRFYVRVKSSLSGKRVKTDPAFAGTMRYAGLLATAAKITSGLYRSLSPEKKVKGLYRILTGKAMRLLKEGYKHEQVVDLLQESLAPKMIVKEREITSHLPAVESYSFADAVIAKIPANVNDTGILFTGYFRAPPWGIQSLTHCCRLDYKRRVFPHCRQKYLFFQRGFHLMTVTSADRQFVFSYLDQIRTI